MKLTQVSHLLNELGIPTIPHVFSDSQSLITSIKNRIYRGTAVAHIATKYYLAAVMARDGEIDLSCVPTAEMLADCYTKPLPKPAFLKQCAAMGMIGIGLGMVSEMVSELELGMASEMPSVRSEMVVGMVSELHMEMASGMPSESKLIDWARSFRGDPQCLIGSSSPLFTVFCLKRT